jgi:hypothetical protein
MTVSAARRFGLLVSLLGISLLLVSFLSEWFVFAGRSSDMWSSFGFVDIIVAISALVAIAVGPAAHFWESRGLGVAVATVSANLAFVGTLLLCWRVIDPPGQDAVREVGIWLGFGLQTAILVFSLAAMGGGTPPRLSSAR